MDDGHMAAVLSDALAAASGQNLQTPGQKKIHLDIPQTSLLPAVFLPNAQIYGGHIDSFDFC